jgi:hypothetical protein
MFWSVVGARKISSDVSQGKYLVPGILPAKRGDATISAVAKRTGARVVAQLG